MKKFLCIFGALYALSQQSALAQESKYVLVKLDLTEDGATKHYSIRTVPGSKGLVSEGAEVVLASGCSAADSSGSVQYATKKIANLEVEVIADASGKPIKGIYVRVDRNLLLGTDRIVDHKGCAVDVASTYQSGFSNFVPLNATWEFPVGYEEKRSVLAITATLE